ncbi:hypothetical protein IGI65_000761 [Enterococcus sp. DIV0755b]
MSYNHLSAEERGQIEAYLREADTVVSKHKVSQRVWQRS